VSKVKLGEYNGDSVLWCYIASPDIIKYAFHRVRRKLDYKKKNISTDRENGRGKKRARGSRG
jgi:hypothetical protein